MPAHIYQRPLADQANLNTPISVVGVLSDYVLGQPYEGRLQIINSIGPHFVRQSGGDILPVGTSITIDEDSKEVVIEWPAMFYVPGRTDEYEATLRNADFEETKGWEFGTGWSITTVNPIIGNHSATYRQTSGVSVSRHTSRYPVNHGKAITATCYVRQGASAKYNAGALILLEWRDEDGVLLSTSRGNLVDDGAKNRYSQSKVVALPPENSSLVNIAFEGQRWRENLDLWIDQFKWDHVVREVIEPISPKDSYIIEIEVIDSTGRVATWSGEVKAMFTIFTSKLYPFSVEDSFGVFASAEALRFGNSHEIFEREYQSTSATPLQFEIRDQVVRPRYAPEDFSDMLVTAVAFEIRDTMRRPTVVVEYAGYGASAQAFSIKTHPSTLPQNESANMGASALEFSIV